MNFGASIKTALTKREDYIMKTILVRLLQSFIQCLKIHHALLFMPKTSTYDTQRENRVCVSVDTEHHGQLKLLKMPQDGNDDVTVMGELEVMRMDRSGVFVLLQLVTKFWLETLNTKLRSVALKRFSPLLIVLALSGCVSTPELVIELYQKCKYRNDCIGDRIGEMLNVG